jgi:hypothetical protein
MTTWKDATLDRMCVELAEAHLEQGDHRDGDVFGGLRAVWRVPLGNPVQHAGDGGAGQLGVARGDRSVFDALSIKEG